jgi:hypothetical protein
MRSALERGCEGRLWCAPTLDVETECAAEVLGRGYADGTALHFGEFAGNEEAEA